MHPTKVSRFERMLDDPLSYVTTAQSKSYAPKIIRRALVFIVIGLVVFVVELILQGHGINIASTFTNTLGRNRANGLVVIWYGAIVLLPAYGIYLLATINRQRKRLARNELAALLPELIPVIQARSKAKESKVDSIVQGTGRILTVAFVSLVIVSVLIIIACVVFVLTQHKPQLYEVIFL